MMTELHGLESRNFSFGGLATSNATNYSAVVESATRGRLCVKNLMGMSTRDSGYLKGIDCRKPAVANMGNEWPYLHWCDV